MLGYPDQAQERVQQALTLAQQLAHPFVVAGSLVALVIVHQWRRDGQALQPWVKALINLATEYEFPYGLGVGTVMQGWMLVEQRQGKEGVALLHQGLEALRASGAKLWWPYLLSLFAEAYRREGQAQEGLTVVTEALTTVHETGQHLFAAELYRLKGALALQSKVQGPESKVAEAEECFLKAIDIAQRQQAKSLELRAVMSLARLWQQQGKRDEARQELAEIYGWFTEGFDTQDLQEAKALLEELGGG
jgi:predicted ATPase